MALLTDPITNGVTTVPPDHWGKVSRLLNTTVFYNVRQQDFGATGNGVTDDRAAIQAAIDATPEGGITVIPPGAYVVAAPLQARRNKTILGLHSPRWWYAGGSPCVIKVASGFVGTKVIHVADKEITGLSSDNDGGRIENLSIDGGDLGTGIDGILLEGKVRDWSFERVNISNVSGRGFRQLGYTRVDTINYNPKGVYCNKVAAASNGDIGFMLGTPMDCYYEDLLAVNNGSHGFYVAAPGDTKISNSRSVFNALCGMLVTGTNQIGGLQVSDFSTDRNTQDGVKIDATGSQPISITNLFTRRDGANALAGGGSFAGVKIIGTSGNAVCPVHINGLVQTVGIEDDLTSGASSPQYGVRSEWASELFVQGHLWGQAQAYLDNGNNTIRRFGSGTTLTTGSWNAPVTANTPPLTSVWAYQEVLTSQSTTSATFTDLGTVGPSITIPWVPAGALITIYGEVDMLAVANQAEVAVTETGGEFTNIPVLATTNTVSETRRISANVTAGITNQRASPISVRSSAAGAKTVKLVYRNTVAASTATFANRRLWVAVLT